MTPYKSTLTSTDKIITYNKTKRAWADKILI